MPLQVRHACICRQELEQSAQCIRSSSRAKPSEASSCAKQRPPRSSATLSHGAMAVPDRAVATHGGGARSPLPRRGRRCKPWRDLGGGTGWRCKGAALGRKEALRHESLCGLCRGDDDDLRWKRGARARRRARRAACAVGTRCFIYGPASRKSGP